MEATGLDAERLLDNPPKPTDDNIPGQLPNDVLKNWGIICSVEPKDLTNDAFQRRPTSMVPDDDTTNLSFEDEGSSHVMPSMLSLSFVA